MYESLQFSAADQPARRSFGIADVAVNGERAPVRTRDVASTPFRTLVEFVRSDMWPQADLLVVTPLSGHFPFLVRDLVLGLLPAFRVYVTDWTNVRHVSTEQGSFGLEENVGSVLAAISKLGAGLTVLGLCQGGVAALAATAILAGRSAACTPSALVLMAAPVDPLANPTRVVRLIRARPLSWFAQNFIAEVPEAYAGRGRLVYPARMQAMALWAYLARRIGEGGEMKAKILNDDGSDPVNFPFLDLYTSVMDLDACFFLENTKSVFHDRLLSAGALYCNGERADPRAIRRTLLLTVEGERDDIAAPGQTGAAHGLCNQLPEHLHRRIVVPSAGHFSLFHGETCRRVVSPAICGICRDRGQRCGLAG